jgi:hypothetical protein
MYFNNRIPGNRLAEESAAVARDSLEWVAEACNREHLEPGRFGDQIYAAVDAGEIDADTASTLVRTFLGREPTSDAFLLDKGLKIETQQH